MIPLFISTVHNCQKGLENKFSDVLQLPVPENTSYLIIIVIILIVLVIKYRKNGGGGGYYGIPKDERPSRSEYRENKKFERLERKENELR